MYQQVTIIGRLGKDVELRHTQSGKAVASFSIATSEGKDQTEWHNIVVWEKTAELCAQYLKKGSLASVIGRIASRKYTDKQGVERLAYEIVASRVVFLSPKEGQQTAAANNTVFPSGEAPDISLEDIPF